VSSCGDKIKPYGPLATKQFSDTEPAGQRSCQPPVTATLTWGAVSNATTYHYQVSSNSDFTSLLLKIPRLLAQWFPYPGLRQHDLLLAGKREKRQWLERLVRYVEFHGPLRSNVLGIGRSQGYLGYWEASDKMSQDSWLYNFLGNLVVISKIKTVVDTVNITII